MRVLVVEDEKDLARALQRSLQEELFAVDLAFDGVEAQFLLSEVAYDVVVLDLMVPKRDGWMLLHDLRSSGSRTPVLILTARHDVEDRVKTLNLGADDYLLKPFSTSELTARLRALVRRAAGHPAPVHVAGDVTVDTAARRVYRDGNLVDLTSREYAILELMLRRRGTLVTRAAICEQIYDEASDVFSNVVDVHVAALRRKLGPALIHTRRGHGYIIDA
jgi:two-component system, OmpR family, response regulator